MKNCKHGYLLLSFPDPTLTKEKENNIFDLCDVFMTTPGCGKLENDDWQILGEQCLCISLMNKHTSETIEIKVDLDKAEEKEMKKVWEGIREEEERYELNVKRVNDRILKVIESLHGHTFIKDLLLCAEESETIGPWEIVRAPKGGYQEEEGAVFEGIWVHQWRDGGYTGDDFAGDIYIKIKDDRYLKMYYCC